MSQRQTVQREIVAHAVDVFVGGLDLQNYPYVIAEGAARLAENVEFPTDRTVRVRPGYVAEDTGPLNAVQLKAARLNGALRFISLTNSDVFNEAAQVATVTESVLVPITNAVLFSDGPDLYQLSADGVHPAAPPVPDKPLNMVVTGNAGSLAANEYEYALTFLLKGGFESERSEPTPVVVGVTNSKVSFDIPAFTPHPAHFKIRVYRKAKDQALFLRIADIDLADTTFEDTGLGQTPTQPIPGLVRIEGGPLMLNHARRLFVVNGDVLTYSYPGQPAFRSAFYRERITLPTGEPIRAMCPLGQGIIFFGLESAVYMSGAPIDGGQIAPIAVPDGCVGQNAWTLAEDGTLFFVGKGGVYAMNGPSSQRISERITPLFSEYGVGQLALAQIIYDQQERRLIVNLRNRILVYNFLTQAWSVWTIAADAVEFFEGTVYFLKGGIRYRFSSGGTDDGEPITARLALTPIAGEDPVTHKQFRRIGLNLALPQGQQIKAKVQASHVNSPVFSETSTPIVSNNVWDNATWDQSVWEGLVDMTGITILPDWIGGRYLSVAFEIVTSNGGQVTLAGPLVVEYRARYRYGRGM